MARVSAWRLKYSAMTEMRPSAIPCSPRWLVTFSTRKKTGFGTDALVDSGPQISLGTFGRGKVSVKKSRKAIHYGLVVNEDMRRPFSRGNQVKNCEGFSALSILDEVMDTRRIVKSVTDTPKDTVRCPCQQRVGLVGASSVGGGVDPV